MKWYTYVICFVLIVCGFFCGTQFYRELKAESYINGSIDISNKFSQETFSYASTSLVFYHDAYDDTDTYSFNQALTKIDDFNGKTNQYQVILNNYILLDTDINAGSVYANIQIDFYDTNGTLIHQAPVQISILYLSSETKLTITTTGKENASFLEQYFKDNGIRLQVNQLIKEVKKWAKKY